MSTKTVSTRRRFFLSAGAAMSAPLAFAGTASRGAGERSTALESRLAALEDANAIRELHETYARLVNERAHRELARLYESPPRAQIDATITGLSAARFGERDVIEIADDGVHATARIHCTVEIETPIDSTDTLVQMARAQGEGVVRRSEHRVLEHTCVRRGGSWKIARSEYQAPPRPALGARSA